MNRLQVAEMMQHTFTRLDKLREAGQKEYAHAEDNAFANFERVANDLQIDRKKVLWTYLRKHLDGIVAHINGHKSQRESVHGRIDDVHVYLELLRGMIIAEGEPEPNVPPTVFNGAVSSIVGRGFASTPTAGPLKP